MKGKLKLYYFIIGILVALFVSTCACFCVIATGHVNTKRLIIYSGTAEKAYDGTPLTSDMYGIKNGKLKSGHTLVATPYGEQTEVGIGLNHFHYMIVDENGESVEDEYRVICAPGVLLVHEPGWIDLEKLESVKDYIDEFGEFDVDASGLDFEEDMFENLMTEGMLPNINGDDSKLSLEKLLGALGMLMTDGKLPPELDGSGASEETEGESSGAGVGGFSNDINNVSNGLGDEPEKEVLKVYSDKEYTYYFRYESFGDYNGTGWENPVANTDSVVSPLYYAALALNTENKNKETVKIEILDGSGMYFLPYYSLTGITNEQSDVKFNYKSNSYTASVITDFDYLSGQQVPAINENIVKYEKKYRDFVHSKYLKIDADIKNELVSLTNFNASGLTLINDIKNYVQNSATYNINFEPFPENVDIVTYFLKQSKEGICQHFAAAGTMLYRAYGIPARYTCGYMVNAKAETWTTITAKYGHAWVEIYVDGFGWVPVEVTGSGYEDVRKNMLTISTVSRDKVYDGQEFSQEDALAWEVLSGYLYEGHEIVAAYEQKPQLPIKVGTTENSGFDYKIVDRDGNDVTNQYIISAVSYGTLTIDKRPITIIAGTGQVEYTGEPVALPIYDSQIGLLDSDKIIVDSSTTATDIGSYVNNIQVKIENELEEDVTEQYEITITPGEMEVIKIKLYVDTHSYSHVYNGGNAICKDYFIMNDYKLLSGHTHAFKEDSYVNFIKEVGETASNEFKIWISDGQTDVTDTYYDVQYSYGQLSVLPIYLELTTESGEKIYDGNEFSVSGYNIYGTLFGNDQLKEKSYAKVTDVGTYENVLVYDIIEIVGGQEVSVLNRYDVNECWGELKIFASEITITTATDFKTYDGTALSNDTFTYSGTLFGEHEIRLKSTAVSILEPGEIENRNEYGVFVIGTDEEIVGPYKITYDYGTLTVNRIEISVKNSGAEKIYDGTALSCTGKTYTGNLLDGHVLQLVGEPISILYASSVYNDNRYTVVLENEQNGQPAGTDVSYLYDISYVTDETTMLVINPIVLKIKTGSASKYYDGTPLYCHDYELIEGELLAGHEIILQHGVHLDVCDVRENKNEYTVLGKVQSEDGVIEVDHTSTEYRIYTIQYVYGTLTINKIRIIYSTPSAEKVYDGEPLYDTNVTVIIKSEDGKLLPGHELKVEEGYAQIIEEGWLHNDITLGIYDTETGAPLFEYERIYVIELEDTGILTILPEDSSEGGSGEGEGGSGEGGSGSGEGEGGSGEGGSGSGEGGSGSGEGEGGSGEGEGGSGEGEGGSGEGGSGSGEGGSGSGEGGSGSGEGGSGSGEGGSGSGEGGSGSGEGGSGSGEGGSGSGEGGSGSGQSGESTNLATNTDQIRENFNKTVFVLYTSRNGKLYLRELSYGDYTGNGFGSPVVYDSEFSPLFYVGSYLNQIGVAGQTVNIIMSAGNKYNLLPYYSVGGTPTGDIKVNHGDVDYTLTAYLYDYLSGGKIVLTDQLASMELDYRSFVYSNYLNIDTQLKNRLISEFSNPLGFTGKDLIQYLAQSIQASAMYSLDFKYENGADIIDQFLTNREGICQHYAATATMLYRAYGIPARFVTGFVVDAKANVRTEVKGSNAHAWVEIYVDGVGWVPVEVTGTTSEENKDTMPKIELMIFSASASKTYDGTPLRNYNYTCLDDSLLLEGHKIVVTSGTQITDVSVSDNVIKIKIIDINNDNKDVTDMYDVKMSYGQLKIIARGIVVQTDSITKEYDGQVLAGSMEHVHTVLKEDRSVVGLVDGHFIEGQLIGKITEPGNSENAINNVKIFYIGVNGEKIEVTKNYAFDFEFGMLSVTMGGFN